MGVFAASDESTIVPSFCVMYRRLRRFNLFIASRKPRMVRRAYWSIEALSIEAFSLSRKPMPATWIVVSHQAALEDLKAGFLTSFEQTTSIPGNS